MDYLFTQAYDSFFGLLVGATPSSGKASKTYPYVSDWMLSSAVNDEKKSHKRHTQTDKKL